MVRRKRRAYCTRACMLQLFYQRHLVELASIQLRVNPFGFSRISQPYIRCYVRFRTIRTWACRYRADAMGGISQMGLPNWGDRSPFFATLESAAGRPTRRPSNGYL